MARAWTASLTMIEGVAPHTIRVIAGAVIGLIFVLALPGVRLIWFDPRDYYTYQGTEGPLQAIGQGAALHAGDPISTIHPGERFAWITTLCFAEGVDVRAIVELREERTGKIVSRREREVAADDRRCGPHTVDFRVPADAEPGTYAAERKLVIEPRSSSPISAQLPSIEIEVVAS